MPKINVRLNLNIRLFTYHGFIRPYFVVFVAQVEVKVAPSSDHDIDDDNADDIREKSVRDHIRHLQYSTSIGDSIRWCRSFVDFVFIYY